MSAAIGKFFDSRCKTDGYCQNPAIHRDWYIDEDSKIKLFRKEASRREVIGVEANLLGEDFLLCQGWVDGYILTTRSWKCLGVRLVRDIHTQQDGFNSLVLPLGHKYTLLALVETHSRANKLSEALGQDAKRADVVRGKGEGLIFLHGEPGVGKSSIAECVSEHMGHPLY